jgi:transposase
MRGCLFSLQEQERRSNPYFSKPFLKLDNQTYKLNYLILRIPIEPRRYHYITLSGSAFHRSFLANRDLKLGSVILTESNVVVTFSKETIAIERKGTMGIDVNERNLTWSDSLGESKAEDTSMISEVKELYNETKARITRRTYRDRRILLRLLDKYGRRCSVA